LESDQKTEEAEEQLTKVFIEFLSAQDEGFHGSFEEYYWDRFGLVSPTVALRKGWKATEEDVRVRTLMNVSLYSCIQDYKCSCHSGDVSFL